MSTRMIRFIANGTITVFSLLLIAARLAVPSSSGYHWLWGIPGLLIIFLDLYFLTKSLLREPKQADTGLVTFLLSVGGSLGFAFSAVAVIYPVIEFPHSPVLRELGGVLSLLPYPLVFWALLCLKDCLTVIPEAHTVVARGIYRYSRHPLYMGYIIWAVANMMMFPSWPMITVSLTHIAILGVRLKREERLLLATFPEYHSYYQATGLVGGIRMRLLLGE